MAGNLINPVGTDLNTGGNINWLVNNHYKYDHNGNCLTKETLAGVQGYGYDSQNRLVKAEYPTYTESLYYDRAGNRTRYTSSNNNPIDASGKVSMNPYMAASGNEAQISGSIEIDYIYGVGNRLLEMTTRSGSGREDITKFEYDPQGNLLKDGKARYTYDSFNRLQKAETFDGQVQINHYDGEGLRHEIEENGELVQFIYSDKEVVAETNTNGELTRYIRGLGLISADSEKARNYYHYCSDELGSITHILDEEGNTLNNYEYDAFGNTTLCKENVPNRFRYTGQQYDKVTEQYYLRARYYNPIIGRFLQEDSYYNDGLNLYAYGDNNPVRYIDPSGYTKVDAHDKLPGNQQASMDGLNNPQKKTWNEFQHTNKGKYTKAEMSQAWSDYKKSFDINTPKAEIPNNTPTQGNVGRSNKGGSEADGFDNWLNKGKNDNKVYYGIKDGEAKYTGITKQTTDARLYQHNKAGKGFTSLDVQYDGLTRNQARAIEQYLIENGSNTLNKINSISQNNKYYSSALEWAKKYIKNN